MKALLIQPDYPLDHKYNPKNALLLPPLGLECIAAHVRDVAETRIIDNRLHDLSQIKEEIENFHPDFVGISCCFSFGIDHVLKIARVAKEQGASTILGGWHPTLLADDVLASPHVDIVVRSEGEQAFRELVQRGTPVGVAGVSYKEESHVIHNPDRPFADLNSFKMPSRDLRFNGARHAYGFFGYPIDVVESSRGCPYSCTFCAIYQFYRRTYRHRSIPHVMRELREIRKHCRSVYFIDDNFVVNPGYVDRLCDAIIRERLNMVFITTARADMVVSHPELFKKMADAGFILVFMGLENFSDASLEKLNKQLSFEQITAAIKILHDLGFIIQGNIILGADLSNTEADLERTIRVAKRLDVDITTFSLLTPFPGTELMERVRVEGLLLKEEGAWRDFNWVTPTIRYRYIAPDRLAMYHLKAYEDVPFFSHPGRRIVRILRTRHFSFLIDRLCNWETLKGFILMVAKSFNRFLNKRRKPAA